MLFSALFSRKITIVFSRHGLENKSYVIVAHFFGQQLYKKADLCNCWPFFEPTIIHTGACSTKLKSRYRRKLCNAEYNYIKDRTRKQD